MLSVYYIKGWLSNEKHDFLVIIVLPVMEQTGTKEGIRETQRKLGMTIGGTCVILYGYQKLA